MADNEQDLYQEPEQPSDVSEGMGYTGEMQRSYSSRRRRNSIGREIMEWVFAIASAVIIAVIVRTFIFNFVYVDGPSMQPTLETGDRLYVNKLFYTPKNGDVIVFRPYENDKKYYIKRVIAVEGQEINIDFASHKVYVDGVVLDEPYIKAPTNMMGDIVYPVTVPEDCVFVMGDNRNNSHDSRRSDVGMVKRKSIMGNAIFRWWPINKFSGI